MAIDFDKYKVDGAIHWAQTNRMGLKYNAPLVSRYSSVLKRVPLNARIVLDIGCGNGYLSCQMARRLPPGPYDLTVMGKRRQGRIHTAQ